MIQYRTVVPWDKSLVDVGFADSSVSSGLKGLAICAIKITAGAPQANAGYFIPSAKIYNAADGTEYRNTGSTAAPTWSLVETSGSIPATTIVFNTDATAGPITIPAAKIVDAIFSRNGGTVDRTDTTDTAANIIAAIPGAVINSSFMFYLQNASTTPGQKITLAAGAGVTLFGVEQVYAGGRVTIIGRVTNVVTPAVSFHAETPMDALMPASEPASAVNTLNYSTSATAKAPSFTAVGTDTNIGIKVIPKGTGPFSNLGATTLATESNFIATETGANNAIVGALVDCDALAVPLVAGLHVVVKLAHTLQAGANTFALNAVVKNIKSHLNAANNIGTAYAATGVIDLVYDGTQWLDMSL